MTMINGTQATSRTRADAVVVGPSLFVRVVMGPMTKVLNPVVRRIAGRRHFQMAGKVHHVGRRTGRRYVTPTGTRLDGGRIIVPLTFGNRSDWCRNVLAAGGCEVELQGRRYQAEDPGLYWREDIGPQLSGPFNPMERLAFQMLGIRQFLVLRTARELRPKA